MADIQKKNSSRQSDDSQRQQQLRALRRKRQRELQRRRRQVYFYRCLFAGVLILVLAGIIGIVSALFRGCGQEKEKNEHEISQAVTAYKPLVEQYAKASGVEAYVDVLLAMMMVETRGEGNDVMQSSESLGLPINSLEPEASIEQGCKVFASHLEYSQRLGCDLDSVIQSYNFGPGYLEYVAGNGKVHTFDLACEFAEKMSGGEKVEYVNDLSSERNGGWRYNYGNMFYVELVHRYWSGDDKAGQQNDLDASQTKQQDDRAVGQSGQQD